MSSSARRPAVLLLVVAGAGVATMSCRARRSAEPAASVPSAGELVVRHFEPPADRLLTDRHLDLYLKVRRAIRAPQGSRASRSESDAARALGQDPDELAWIRARIVEALVALDASRVRRESSQTYERTIASLRMTLKSVRDPQIARTIQGEIAALERERGGLVRPDSVPSDIAANARKVADRRAELEAALQTGDLAVPRRPRESGDLAVPRTPRE